MPSYRYRIVDVFTQNKLEGNPLAVFPEAAGLDECIMQKLAQELNLSETTFVLPPSREGCIARVRIFTPAREMRFAGHPTIGTAWVLRDEGSAPQIEFQLDELVGPVPVRVDGALLWLRTPPVEFGVKLSPNVCASLLGLPDTDLLPIAPQVVSAGNPNLYIALRNRDAVDRASVELAGLRGLRLPGEPVCVFVFTPEPTGAYSRMFAPEHGIVEDPATGSATGPLAAYMMAHGRCSASTGTRLLSEQGVKMGRRSLLHIHIAAGGHIEVGGAVTPVASGAFDL